LFNLKGFDHSINESVNLSLHVSPALGIENNPANFIDGDWGLRVEVSCDVFTESIDLLAAVTAQ
jgi:hypothetical protein